MATKSKTPLTDQEFLQAISEGGPFDTVEAIRRLATFLATGSGSTKPAPQAITTEQARTDPGEFDYEPLPAPKRVKATTGI